MAWKKLSSRIIYKNKWMEITEDLFRTGSGKKWKFGIVHKKPFTLIIPWDGKYLTLVGQYRVAIKSFSWGFPQGHFEHHTISETAKEELEEETGLIAKKIKKIASFQLAPGHHTQICHVFLATELKKGKINPEESEERIRIKKVTLKNFRKMVIKGQLKDGPTLAAYSLVILNKFISELNL